MKFSSRALTLWVVIGLLWSGGPRPQADEERDPEVVAVLRNLLSSPQPDVRASALKWISRDPRAQDESLLPAIFGELQDKDGGVRSQALANMGWIFERRQGRREARDALGAILGALRQTSDRAMRLVAVDLLRGSAEKGEYEDAERASHAGSLIADAEVQSLVASLLADPESGLRPELLQVVEASRTLQEVPAVVQAVGAALHDDNLTVRSNAADLLIAVDQKGSGRARDEARRLLLAALGESDPNVQWRVSRALGVPPPPRKTQPAVLSLTGEKVSTADVPFDFNYFTAFVQPLLVTKSGNVACVDCHTPEANATGSFRILAPGANGRYTLEQSRVNFVSVLSVIDRKNPERSKLLLKPLNPRAPEGGLRGLTHDGGVFWDNRYDPDFEILDGWLKGAKVDVLPEKQLDFAYFVQRVEPIFSTPGQDGFACINCHSTHAIFHLESPETRGGTFSVDQLTNNYQSAHRVIDEGAPSNSFIVRKPTSPREGEPGGLSHAGGVRWSEKKDSWQYRTLVTWIGLRNLATK